MSTYLQQLCYPVFCASRASQILESDCVAPADKGLRNLLVNLETTVNISLVIVAVYIILMFVMGFVLTHRSKTTSELFIGKQELGVLLLIPLLFGEVIAGASTTGTAQGGYIQGVSAVWTFVGKGLGSIVFAYLLVKFFVVAGKAGAMSVPEAFKWRFDGRLRVVMVFIFGIPVGLICASQCRALASLLGPMTGLNINMLIVISVIVFGLLGLSGIKGIAKMNIVNSVVILFGVIFTTCIVVAHQGGLGQVLADAPAGHDNFAYPSIPEILGQFISGLLAYCVTISPTNACYSTGDKKASRVALVVTGIMSIIFAFFPMLIGLAGASALPGVDANTILYSMPASISPVLSGLVNMAVLAAVISTSPFFYLSFSTVVVRDIVLPLKPGLSEKKQMRISAVVELAFTAMVIVIALNMNSIFGQIIGANHIKACAGLLLIVALFSRWLTNSAAFWSLLVSGGLSTVWYFSGSVFGLHIEPLWPALAIEIALMVIISLLDKQHRGKDYEDFVSRIPKNAGMSVTPWEK